MREKESKTARDGTPRTMTEGQAIWKSLQVMRGGAGGVAQNLDMKCYSWHFENMECETEDHSFSRPHARGDERSEDEEAQRNRRRERQARP